MCPHLGTPLAELEPSEVQAWAKRAHQQQASNTNQVVYGVFASTMKSAVIDRENPSSPRIGITLPQAEPKDIVIPTDEQTAIVCETIKDRFKALIHFVLASSLRRGQSSGLTADIVDSFRGFMKVDRQVLYLKGKGSVFGPPSGERGLPAGHAY